MRRGDIDSIAEISIELWLGVVRVTWISLRLRNVIVFQSFHRKGVALDRAKKVNSASLTSPIHLSMMKGSAQGLRGLVHSVSYPTSNQSYASDQQTLRDLYKEPGKF
jgi:hypothetical protein